VVHGLAGSAAVALLVLARFLIRAGVFTCWYWSGTVGGMMLITMSIASAFTFMQGQAKILTTTRIDSGVLSLAFGLLLVYQIGFAAVCSPATHIGYLDKA